MRIILSLFIALVIVLTAFFLWPARQETSLIFFSGAGMKGPVDEIAQNYEQETGIRVQTHFEGSSVLREHIIKFKTGDIFLPGDKKNLDKLSDKNLVSESTFIAWHVVAILVSPQFKDRIHDLNDLAQKGVRLAFSNPRQASLGRIVMKNIINKHPKGQDILANVVMYGSSSQDVLKIYRAGGIDAIIEWDVMASTPEGKGLVVVPLKEPYQVKDKLYAGLLTTARDQKQAKKFYKYLSSKGKQVFRKYGYNTEEKGQLAK